MSPPLELNYLSLRCHFDGYGDGTPDSNSHWSCSKEVKLNNSFKSNLKSIFPFLPILNFLAMEKVMQLLKLAVGLTVRPRPWSHPFSFYIYNYKNL